MTDKNLDKDSKSRLYTYHRLYTHLYKYSCHAFFLLFWIFINIWCILSTQKQRIEVLSDRESASRQAIVDHDELVKIRSRPGGLTSLSDLIWCDPAGPELDCRAGSTSVSKSSDGFKGLNETWWSKFLLFPPCSITGQFFSLGYLAVRRDVLQYLWIALNY
jgi:hypothetical protein